MILTPCSATEIEERGNGVEPMYAKEMRAGKGKCGEVKTLLEDLLP
jgi:hypothetical protein